jgi:hypothetical protein
MSPDPNVLLEEVRRPATFAALCPALTIGGSPATSCFTLTPDEELEVRSNLLDEGWFHLGERLPRPVIDRLAEGVRRLHAAGVPPVYLYMFDEPWYLSQWLGGFLGALLGADFKVQPALWAWYVETGRGGKGWDPHRDKRNCLFPNGTPKSLSVWVPLTEATPWNGCMYVYPARHDPAYRERADGLEVPKPQEVRALPAAPGSVLGWTQQLLHWGGRSSERAAGPRLSFSIEYQRGDVPPMQHTVIDPWTLPSFEERVWIVAKQIAQYDHMHETDAVYAAVSQAIVSGQKLSREA